MRLLYSLVYRAALAGMFPSEYLKRPPHLRSTWLREKRGFPAIPPTPEGAPVLWLHAVSVGESIAAVQFIKAFKSSHPDYRIVISTITDTGRAVATERLGSIAEVIYVPFDLMGPLRRAIRHIRPTVFAVMETELWPNLFRAMREAGTRVALLNGRISERSFPRYMKGRWLLRPVLDDIDAFCMQDSVYAGRIVAMGARAERVHPTGNFKFDITVNPRRIAWAESMPHPVIVVGSTHKGEEPLAASMYMKVRERIPTASLVLAPRHPNRADEAAEALASAGVAHVRRSAISDGQPLSAPVVLLDTVGELASVYASADVAIIGGSFIPHGGQNPLEPSAYGKPVICGPHMDNFPFVKELYDSGAAMQTDADHLADDVTGLLTSPERSAVMGRMGAEFIERNRGAVNRALRVIEGLLP